MQANANSPNFHAGPEYVKNDVHLSYRYYTYPTESGLVSAGVLNVMFTIDAPARRVWPHFKDFNLWHKPYGYSYTGVVGDLEGKTFELDVGGKNNYKPSTYEVLRVIPQQLMIFSETVPSDGRTGGMRAGFHAFTLNEFGNKTVITYGGDHATRTDAKTDDEALIPWREFSLKVLPMWHDSFIPTLKGLVAEAQR